ncbi:ABC transporter ATP-binding protein [Jiangella anatolica]|uniref:Methionine ABC transporter ATP-binding protein n=1 Tax=Jiangella anatolica TaxID=2670374 RepID=A0A2W2CCC5_9ACTN|nr:ABC transporter ATP-binding protein [Jiangella anatolica]PZF85869.1 methionine ABC transporter ATP-binding protein [Jiangella anatolica]
MSALLEVRDLVVEFGTEAGTVHAVNGVSFDVEPGEMLCVVGESGSGKSVTAMAVLGLLRRPPARVSASGIRFRGEDLLAATPDRLRALRGDDISVIFQDPMTALNPVHRVGKQIAEVVRLHRPVTRKQAWQRAVDLLTLVGVPDPDSRARQYPHEFSGGMRQRVMIAMAIANDPALLIADEPTTALDVTIQAQVLGLLRKAQRETGAATILITHDLGVVAEMADRVVVMYGGAIVEQGDVTTVFAAPRHPYTLGLLESLPRLDRDTEELTPISGSPPNLVAPPVGCTFAARCPVAAGRDRCVTERPGLVPLAPGHASACHFHEELVMAR